MADNQREDSHLSGATTSADRDVPQRLDRPRSRSRSPRRERREDKPRRKDKGFKWKEKRRDDDNDARDRDPGLQRGYRDYYRPRARSRSRSRSRSPRRDRSPRRNRSPQRNEDKHERRDSKREQTEAAEKKEKREKKPAVAAPQEPMIIVNVNDRLGTKKAIPCFASDTIKDFKVIVASMVGRSPHEILIKRQSERPFKDQLTLRDYGVSNGVQLDLEVDTGD